MQETAQVGARVHHVTGRERRKRAKLMGKGSTARPLSVSRKTFADNFDRAFRKKGGMLRCPTHGPLDWEGHVVCSDCERVYQTHDKVVYNYAPLRCPCGSRLLPCGKRIVSGEPLCPRCYKKTMGF